MLRRFHYEMYCLSVIFFKVLVFIKALLLKVLALIVGFYQGLDTYY